MMMSKVSLFTLIIFAMLLSNPVFAQESSKTKKPNNQTNQQEKKEEEKKEKVSVYTGYNFYKMDDFNDKLSREGNKNIDGGLNVGLEFHLEKIAASILDVIGGPSIEIPIDIPVGIEYLEASSKTTHDSTVVNWELPVVGIYLMPDISNIFGNSEKKMGGD